MTPGILLLSPQDNIVVATRRLEAGEIVSGETGDLCVTSVIHIGHKIAARPIRAGEKIMKYGAPIGSATVDIARGEHVHLHNMQSDYLPTYTLDPEKRFVQHP